MVTQRSYLTKVNQAIQGMKNPILNAFVKFEILQQTQPKESMDRDSSEEPPDDGEVIDDSKDPEWFANHDDSENENEDFEFGTSRKRRKDHGDTGRKKKRKLLDGKGKMLLSPVRLRPRRRKAVLQRRKQQVPSWSRKFAKQSTKSNLLEKMCKASYEDKIPGCKKSSNVQRYYDRTAGVIKSMVTFDKCLHL